jgi:hypothetical protein
LFIRYAAEEQNNYEFAQAARQNYEHGKIVREKLTGNAQRGSSEVFSASKDRVELQKQGSAGSSVRGRNDSYGAKENMQHNQYEDHQQNGYYKDEYSVAPTDRNSDSCHEKYEAMLHAAANKRLKEKYSPRSTSFY